MISINTQSECVLSGNHAHIGSATMFKLEFSTANEAFDELKPEITRILVEAAAHIEQYPLNDDRPVTLSDINGNTIGQFTYTHK